MLILHWILVHQNWSPVLIAWPSVLFCCGTILILNILITASTLKGHLVIWRYHFIWEMEKWVKKLQNILPKAKLDLKYKIQAHLLNFYILFKVSLTKSIFFAHIGTSRLQFSLFQSNGKLSDISGSFIKNIQVLDSHRSEIRSDWPSW